MGVVTAVRSRCAGQGLGTAPPPPHTHTWCSMWSARSKEAASEEPLRGLPGLSERGCSCLTGNAALSSEVRRWRWLVAASLTSETDGFPCLHSTSNFR